MKKVYLIIITILVCLIISVSAQTESNTVPGDSISSQDTTVVKSINDEGSNSTWDILLPYIIGGFITGFFTILGVFLTLRYQRKIAQGQIDAETKRKFIDDLIEVIKRVRLILFDTFNISHDILKNIPQDIVSAEESEECRNRIDEAMNKLYDKTLEFYYWNGSLFLYLSDSNSEYESIRKLSHKLSKSYESYINYFSGINIPTKERESKYGDILVERADRLMSKLQEIIDSERANITNIHK